MKIARDLLLLAAVLAGLAFFWVRDCSGPRPRVVAVHATPPAKADAPWLVEVTIESDGPGEGAASASVKLLDEKTGEAWEKDEEVDLAPGRTSHLTVEIHAPERALHPTVELSYPPR